MDEATLTLTYSKTLDSGVTLPVNAFSVSINGESRSVSAVSVLGSAVKLTLASVVFPGETVTVSYTRPSGINIIRDTRGRIAGSFSDRTVYVFTAPLFLRYQNVPRSHDGSASFDFFLSFTRAIPDSSESMLADAFTVTGGEVTGALDTRGNNDTFRINVQPSGNADVTVSLPATTDCADTGAICTSSGVRLTDTLELTVPGPSSQNQTTNTPAEGVPTITGTPSVGQTLSADTSGITDADGLETVTFDYQWLANDAEIAGATAATYTVAPDDVSRAIMVKVTFTDDAGNEESLTSAATEAVAARPNTPATGAPTISGTAQVGETLTADTSGIRDADGLTNASFTRLCTKLVISRQIHRLGYISPFQYFLNVGSEDDIQKVP